MGNTSELITAGLLNLCCTLASKHEQSRLNEFEYKLYEQACVTLAMRLKVEEIACDYALQELEADHAKRLSERNT